MKIIQIVIAVLLLLCLFKMPYGYYELVRFVALIAFGYMAFVEYQASPKSILVVVYIALAFLFQPFFKLALGREIWNFVDVVVALFLIVISLKKQKSN